jgi:hypothetical protein
VTTADIVTRIVSLLLIPFILVGLARTRLYRASRLFTAYLMVVWLSDVLPLLWPRYFFVWTFWQLKETALGALKLGIAIEIASLAYHSFPRAGAAVMRGLLIVLVIGICVIVGAIPSASGVAELARELQPRLANVTVLVFCLVWALIIWYRIPLHFMHRALLRGFVPYLLVFATVRGLMMDLGWNVWQSVNLADTISYCLLLLYWAWEVWRTHEQEDPFLRTLQPWRAKL